MEGDNGMTNAQGGTSSLRCKNDNDKECVP